MLMRAGKLQPCPRRSGKPEIDVKRSRTSLKHVRPAKALKLLRDLGVIRPGRGPIG